MRGGGNAKLIVPRLRYVGITRHRIGYTTGDGDHEPNSTRKNVETALAAARFARCNSCYLVNLGFVDMVKEFVCYVGGDELQISQRKRKDFMKALNDYIGGGFDV